VTDIDGSNLSTLGRIVEDVDNKLYARKGESNTRRD
jgi:hypothetical protein